MAKHLIDTDLYIDLIQGGTTFAVIRELYDKEAPGIYFSSIVAQELLAGARSPAGRRRVETLFRPFERVGRVVNSRSQSVEGRWSSAGQGPACPVRSQGQTAREWSVRKVWS